MPCLIEEGQSENSSTKDNRNPWSGLQHCIEDTICKKTNVTRWNNWTTRRAMGIPTSTILHRPSAQKMMTFEYGRYMKATIAVFLSGQTACFNRMWPALTNVVAQAYRMEPKVCECQANTIDSTVRHIQTGFGVSKGSYGNTAIFPKIQGKIQGKGNVANQQHPFGSLCNDLHRIIPPRGQWENNIKRTMICLSMM